MARNPYGDEVAIRDVARRCKDEADRLSDVARRWEDRIARARWECARADRTRDEVRATARSLRHDADRLRDLAGQLHRHADRVRDLTVARDRAERAVRSWWQINRDNPRIAPYRPWFPNPGTVEWIGVRDQIRRRFGGI